MSSHLPKGFGLCDVATVPVPQPVSDRACAGMERFLVGGREGQFTALGTMLQAGREPGDFLCAKATDQRLSWDWVGLHLYFEFSAHNSPPHATCVQAEINQQLLLAL